MIKRILAAAVLPLVMLTPVQAEEAAHEAAIEYRQSLMNVMSWNLKPMRAMFSDKRPYDQSVLARHAQDLASASALDVLTGFPEDSEDEDSSAMAEIWLDWDDFAAKYQDLKAESAKLAEVAGGAYQAAIGAQVAATAKTCKACHKQYKE